MQNIQNEVIPKSRQGSYVFEAVRKLVTAKPVVAAAINQEEYSEFIAPHLNNKSWPFNIERIDCDYTNDDLVGALNRNKSRILMTCWRTKPLPADISHIANSLKYVVHLGGAVKYFLPREIVEQGILVSNWGNTAARTVAEHSLLQVLACLRRATKWQIDMHIHNKWRENYESFSLFGRRVGIYGFGHCAREFVKLIRPFGCFVSVFSESLPKDIDADIHCEGSLEDLFSKNEIIVVLEAITGRTFKTVNESLLRKIPASGVFVNTARGAIVDEEALCKVAKENKIQIALDVFEKEPLPEFSSLRGCENVFLTPHIAGPTTDSRNLCGLYALENIKNYLSGQPVKSVVGLAEYDRMSSV